MIYCIERHHVMGEENESFEALYRHTYVPRLGDTDDARLLWYTQSPHGAGEAYYNITITGFNDLAAWERWAERLRCGDLADWLEEVDSRRYRCEGSLVSEVPWSPLSLASLPPAAPGNADPTLFRLDTVGYEQADLLLAGDSWQNGGGRRAVLRLVGAFRSLLAPLDERRALLLYRIGNHDEVVEALNVDSGTRYWAGGPVELPKGTVHLETRVLRTTSWSPLS